MKVVYTLIIWFIFCFFSYADTLLTDVNYDPIYKSINLYSTDTLTPQITYLDSPLRIVIDLPNCIWSNKPQTIEVKNSVINRIRIAQNENKPPKVRIVLDINSKTELDFKVERFNKYFLFKIFFNTNEDFIIEDSNQVKNYIQSIEIKENYLSILCKQNTNPQIKQINNEYNIIFNNTTLVNEGEVKLNHKLIKNLKLYNENNNAIIYFSLHPNYAILPSIDSNYNKIIFKIITLKEAYDLIQIQDVILDEISSSNATFKIISNGVFKFKISREYAPNKLIIDTYNTRLNKLTPPQIIKGNIIKAISFQDIDEDTNKGIRINLELNSQVSYSYNLDDSLNSLEIKLNNNSETLKFPVNINNNITPTPVPIPFKYIFNLNGPIVIDPGHGGTDPGAIGVSGVFEKDVNFKVAIYLKNLLENSGYKVLLTRETDITLYLQPRVDIANNNNASIFISIHSNSIPNPSITGIETYYYTEHSLLLAQTIHNALIKNLNVNDRKVRKRELFVTKKALMPSILLEIGFLTNKDEERKLNDPIYQQRIAQSIFEGIKEYFNKVKNNGEY